MVYELSAYHQKICYRVPFSAYCLAPFLFSLSKEDEKFPKVFFLPCHFTNSMNTIFLSSVKNS